MDRPGITLPFQRLFNGIETILCAQHEAHRTEGLLPQTEKVTLKIVGQIALLLQGLDVRATVDLDAYSNLDPTTLSDLIRRASSETGVSLVYDPLSEEIWMPDDTRYVSAYEGERLSVSYAEAVFVYASKAKFRAPKDRAQLEVYMAAAPQEFFEVCKKHNIDPKEFC